MVLVRPTVKALKQLADGRNLSSEVAEPFKIAQGSDDPDTKLRYLLQAIERSLEGVGLVRDAQRQFDRGLFEKHKQSSALAGLPVFECRERGVGAAWRGAVVVSERDDIAWLLHVDRHDRFHSTAAKVLSDMKDQEKLGPSKLDLVLLRKELELKQLEKKEAAMLYSTLSALKKATLRECVVDFEIEGASPRGGLQIELGVQSTNFEEWELEQAAEDIDMVMVSVRKGDDWEFFQRYISIFGRYLQPDGSMVESLGGNPFVIHCAVTRAHLLSLLDVPDQELPTKRYEPEEPKVFHYLDKASMVESMVTGKAAQAVCGVWWVPVGDEATHAGLPVCPDCQREEPFAQAFRDFLRG